MKPPKESPKKPPPKVDSTAPTTLTAKQKAGMAALVKTGQLEILLRGLRDNLDAEKKKQ